MIENTTGSITVGLAITFLKCLFAFAHDPLPLVPFAGGLLFWIWIWHAHLSHSPQSMWHTWEHELTHALFCLLTLTKVRGFHADEKPYKLTRSNSATSYSGHVTHDHVGGWRGMLITLAPYFFPTFAIALLLLRLVVNDGFQPVVDVLIGVTFGYYAINRIKDIKNAVRVAGRDSAGEHDFQRHGVPVSLAFTVFANLIIMPSILLVLHQGWGAAGTYSISGGQFWLELLVG
ncbi:MAG: hypothetical protein CL784_09385 [Chloroflexi bacterium]|nr:hypothetical protein [Chloroflexota bacterium]